MGCIGDKQPPRRNVCLYWHEKIWLLLDGLQLLAILLSALQPFLPYGWNIWTRGFALFLVDVPTFLRPLSTTNELGPYPLNAPGRAFVLLLLLLIAAVPTATWPRVVYAYEFHERQRELDKIKREQELQRLRRPSQARPSVTAMLACSLQTSSPTILTRCKTVARKIGSQAALVFYDILGVATKLAAAISLFFLPACLAIELPLIFCSDQADCCASTGLLTVRLVCFVGVSTIFLRGVFELFNDVRKATVARQGRQQEEYIQQRELEYLLYINSEWMENKVWLVSSFKGGSFRSYFRIWLLFLKAALITSSSVLGQRSSLPPTGLGWLASLGGKASATLEIQGPTGSLGEAILQDPLGEPARAATAAILMLLFSLLAIWRPPFRCGSSNCAHLVVFFHLIGVTGIGLAAAGSGAKTNSFLLYSNQHLLLAVVHVCSLALLFCLFFFCWVWCFLPTESPVLQQYELMMGYNANACSRSRRTADGRRTFASFFHNFYLVAKHWFKRSYMAKWTGNDCDSWTSSESGSTLEVGETEIREKDYGLQPYQAPWPTRHEHARFWIRVAPRLVEQLVTSSLLVKRYGVAEKQLLPVHLANAAFRDLEALVVQHIGAVEERDTRRRSRRQSSKKSLQEDKQTLEQWLQELRAPPAAGGANDSLTPPDKSLNESLALKDNHRGSKNTGEEGTFVFEQQRKGTQESLWSVDSAAAAAAESAAAATPQALAFRHLERAAHLSKQFGHVKLEDLQHLKRITKALEWTVAEVFEKMSGETQVVKEIAFQRHLFYSRRRREQ